MTQSAPSLDLTSCDQEPIHVPGSIQPHGILLARALITLTDRDELPRRFLAGADAIDIAEQKIALLRQQIEAHRELSRSLAID
jgi:light-regulated signal transduction histidine kinase (bacteriophytochrome)